MGIDELCCDETIYNYSSLNENDISEILNLKAINCGGTFDPDKVGPIPNKKITSLEPLTALENL
jgi:hypothetical protein